MLSDATLAIVLRTREWMNTSLIVDFYTKSYGVVTATARGARRLAATTRGTIQKLTLGESLFHLKKRGPATLFSFEPIKHLAPTKDLIRYLATEAVVEHLLLATPKMVPDKSLWQLALTTLEACNCGKDAVSVLAAYLLKSLKNEGVLADPTHCGHCETELPSRAWYENGLFVCDRCLSRNDALKVETKLLNALLQLEEQRLPRLKLSHKLALKTILFADALFSLHFNLTLRIPRRLVTLL